MADKAGWMTAGMCDKGFVLNSLWRHCLSGRKIIKC
jgi:hypothetical protein